MIFSRTNWLYSWKLMKEEIKEIKCSNCYLNLDYNTFHKSISATHLRKEPFVNIDFYDWFIDCMYHPVREYFTHGHHHCQCQWLQKIKCRPMFSIYSLWSLSVHTYCAMGPRFIRSHSNLHRTFLCPRDRRSGGISFLSCLSFCNYTPTNELWRV